MPRHSWFERRHTPRVSAQETPTTLSQVDAGQTATVLDFRGGRAVNRRLASLGLTPGVQVEMTQNYGRGPLIVTVRGTRLALGRGEAFHIIVEQDGK